MKAFVALFSALFSLPIAINRLTDLINPLVSKRLFLLLAKCNTPVVIDVFNTCAMLSAEKFSFRAINSEKLKVKLKLSKFSPMLAKEANDLVK